MLLQIETHRRKLRWETGLLNTSRVGHREPWDPNCRQRKIVVWVSLAEVGSGGGWGAIWRAWHRKMNDYSHFFSSFSLKSGQLLFLSCHVHLFTWDDGIEGRGILNYPRTKPHFWAQEEMKQKWSNSHVYLSIKFHTLQMRISIL